MTLTIGTTSATLRAILSEAPPRLRAISGDRAAAAPEPGKWSPKQELGHLLDSAANNHQRIVRAQLEDRPAMPGYDGDRWVELHRYQERDWGELIDLWRVANLQLLTAAEGATAEAFDRALTIGPSEPLTLAFVYEDYVRHMLHHLRHIGIAVDDFESPSR